MPTPDQEIDSFTQPWTDKLSHVSQIGGIETSTLNDGPGRGTRIAWINTGTGLRYKVVIDRGMDIADAFYNQHSLAWISHTGITFPEPFSSRGTDWLRTFGGGLLTTCGLSHVGGPESDEHGDRGLHGLISNSAAVIESIIQPDPLRGKMNMSITGIVKQTQVFGPSLELRRTISGTLGEAVLTIEDEVTNLGNTSAPHMLLYHFNFGWPLVDEGSRLLWKGNIHLLNTARDNGIFNDKRDYKKCPAPVNEHRSAGEAVAFVDIEQNGDGSCVCGIHNKKLSLALSLTFFKHQLKWLTNWQHWGPGEYVTALEPCTNPPIGQAKARQQNELQFIMPGKTKSYKLQLMVLADDASIDALLANFL